MTEREALKLALKALQSDDYWTHVEAVNAIHKALAQPEPTAIGKSVSNEEAYWRDEMLSGD